jgi:hypothetical protein
LSIEVRLPASFCSSFRFALVCDMLAVGPHRLEHVMPRLLSDVPTHVTAPALTCAGAVDTMRSDISAMELFGQANVNIDPFSVARRLRAAVTAAIEAARDYGAA